MMLWIDMQIYSFIWASSIVQMPRSIRSYRPLDEALAVSLNTSINPTELYNVIIYINADSYCIKR